MIMNKYEQDPSTTSTTVAPTTTSTTTTIEPTTTSTSTSTLKPTTTTVTDLQTTTEKPQKPTEVPTIPPPADETPSALSACYFDANRKMKTDLMEACKPNKKCRANEVMLDETVGGKRLCCCDIRKELPPPTADDPKLLAPKCYYDEFGNVNQFSTLTAGLDLICPTTSEMVTQSEEGTPTSCCILKGQTTIEPKTVPPGSPPILDAKVTYPDCTLKASGKFDPLFMDYCSDIDKVCRPQHQRKAVNFTDSKNQLVEKCCCEFDTNLPPNPNAPLVWAPECAISKFTNDVKRSSMVRGGPDLVCKPNFKLYTINMPVLSQKDTTVPYSCCLPERQNLPGKPDPDPANYAGPQCNYREDKELRGTFMESCSPNMVCRDQERMINKTLKDPLTNMNVLKCCCEFDATLPPNPNPPSVRAHECYFDYFYYIVMHSLVPYGKDLECQKNFNLVNYTIDVEAKPKVFSCCFPAGGETMPTTPYSGPTIPSTLPMTTVASSITTTGFSGKRTAAPQGYPPRDVKPGECPDCIMPACAQEADIRWVIAHLERPGPPVGKCPVGYTMRRIYPVVERRDLTATKCCCEYNKFPLPVKLGG